MQENSDEHLDYIFHQKNSFYGKYYSPTAFFSYPIEISNANYP